MITKKIGLSLGADLCWPAFYEDIVGQMKPVVKRGNRTTNFEIERVRIEPFSLGGEPSYDVVLDRVTHWYNTSREWIKKAIIADGTYVLNNPFTLQSMEKHTSYVAMRQLGLPVPETWMLPPKEYEHSTDLQATLDQYAEMFDLRAVGEKVGYPAYLKPYDGGAWVGVSRVENADELQQAYDGSGTRLMHLQRAVEPFDLFVRTVAIGPQVNQIRYDPGAALHDRYKVDFEFASADDLQLLEDMVLTINTFFNWDFNSCETMRKDGVFHPIDFANPCPDSQVTSLHFHIPWLVKSKIKWSLFCAATNRKMDLSPRWDPFFKVARTDMPYRDKLAAYGDIARKRLDAERFEDFCATHLSELDEVALEYFQSDRACDIVRNKVAALFPEHEVDHFTDHFWGLIQFWCKTEADRLGTTL